MKVTEALKILSAPVDEASVYSIRLATGFSPLHLKTFLSAHLKHKLSRPIAIEEGAYQDLAGTIALPLDSQLQAVVICLEWSDLDLRLGYRSVEGWRSSQEDILASSATKLSKIAQSVRKIPTAIPIVFSLPLLDPPALFCERRESVGHFELALKTLLDEWVKELSDRKIQWVNQTQLVDIIPSKRLDLNAEWKFGFPYSIALADGLAQQMVAILIPASPMKGLITDLDDTLWRGLVGEEGVDGVSWDLDKGAFRHSVYQAMLGKFSKSGVLLAVASKNEKEVAEAALDRKDILVSKDSFFPLEIHWESKAISIQKILKTWNVLPESVVFIDDNPSEIAEVQKSFPEMKCLLFPSTDAEFGSFGDALQKCFAKDEIRDEDRLRLESIKALAKAQTSSTQSQQTNETFLKEAEGEVTIVFERLPMDPRALELVNKSNQFNLNGRRFTKGDWAGHLKSDETVLMVVSYADKFAKLGKICTLLGKRKNNTLDVEAWALSCRAFGRRIEHRVLDVLFHSLGFEEIHFNFVPTQKNRPVQNFLSELFGNAPRVRRFFDEKDLKRFVRRYRTV